MFVSVDELLLGSCFRRWFMLPAVVQCALLSSLLLMCLTVCMCVYKIVKELCM